jgi:hypothetical protein
MRSPAAAAAAAAAATHVKCQFSRIRKKIGKIDLLLDPND